MVVTSALKNPPMKVTFLCRIQNGKRKRRHTFVAVVFQAYRVDFAIIRPSRLNLARFHNSSVMVQANALGPGLSVVAAIHRTIAL